VKPDLVRSGAVLLLVLALAACGSGNSPAQDAAGGEVLQGSVSDAMLPLDSVRSQPPLATKAADDAGENGEKSKDGPKAESLTSPSADSEPAPDTEAGAATPADSAAEAPKPGEE
jgi:hypothetical protein